MAIAGSMTTAYRYAPHFDHGQRLVTCERVTRPVSLCQPVEDAIKALVAGETVIVRGSDAAAMREAMRRAEWEVKTR
jgi:hypothetical protein